MSTSLPRKSAAAPAVPENCLVRDVLDRIGDKWSLLIIANLGRGPVRFKELQRRTTGISQRMLTQTLRLLEREGLVWRHVMPTAPVTVEYGLTRLGETLIGPVQTLHEWSEQNRHAIVEARAAFDLKYRDEGTRSE